MTAASGILHKEYHDADWARTGGRFHMAQLWVNLPADHKMDTPHYQPLTAEQIGQLDLADNAGTVRVDRRKLRRPHRPGGDLHTDQPVGRRTHRWRLDRPPRRR